MAETAERGGDPWRKGQDSLSSPSVAFSVAIAQVVVRRVIAGLDGAAREEELVFDGVHAALVAHGPGQLQRLELRCVADGRVLLHAAVTTSFWCQVSGRALLIATGSSTQPWSAAAVGAALCS
ncbi:unnamed protein product [Closterium sp. NIES-54]